MDNQSDCTSLFQVDFIPWNFGQFGVFDWANLLCYLLIAFDWDRCDVAKEQIHALKMAELCESYQNESNKQRRAKKYSYIAKI